MARQSRKGSRTGIHHVMVRGINRQNIFEEGNDCAKFLHIVSECKRISGFKLLGYCLMGNHVHLLVGEGSEPLGHTMKRIGVRYVSWYNRKYERSGHLFQDRFKSEPVEQDRHLLSVLRYIHQNPVKAGLCGRAEEYNWSSCGCYTGTNASPAETDTEEILAMFSTDVTKQTDLFRMFTDEKTDDSFLDIENVVRLTDRECRDIFRHICGAENVTQFQSMSEKERDRGIRLAKANGMSVRQIARLTGSSFGIVRSR